MQLSHARDEGLTRFLVCLNFKRWIFQSQFMEGGSQFLKISFGFGFNGNGDYRVREVHRFEDNRLFFTADSIPCRCMLQTDGREDISSKDLLNLLSFIGMHLDQTSDSLSLSLGRIENRIS